MKTNEISKLLKENDIRIHSYIKKNNYYIVDTNKGKFIVKKNINRKNIYDYLKARGFTHYPKILINDNYQLIEYIEDTDMPEERKSEDLINLISTLHNKTTFYKEINNEEYLSIYEELSKKYNDVYNYYTCLVDDLDNEIFYSPSNYLLLRNISLIFESLNMGKGYLEEWLEKTQKEENIRLSIINNNVSLDNYRQTDIPYLIDWDKSKIDMPIFDLCSFYKNQINVDYYEILKRYEKKYPLKNIEKDLLIILLLVPDKIKLIGNDYSICKKIRNCIDRLSKTQKFFFKYQKSIHKD